MSSPRRLAGSEQLKNGWDRWNSATIVSRPISLLGAGIGGEFTR